MAGSLRQNGVVEDSDLSSFHVRASSRDLQSSINSMHRRVRSGDFRIVSVAGSAYRSFLAYYIGKQPTNKIPTQDIVDAANEFSTSIGLPTPILDHNTASKLGLVGVPGISVGESQL